MAQPGPKPIPSRIKERMGNPGKRPANKREPKPAAKAPKRPEHLDEEGRKAWRWLCRELKQMGLLASSDLAVMTIYCDEWSRYIKAQLGVQKYGDVLISTNTNTPFISAYTSVGGMHRKALMQAAAEMGLSPSARSRVQVSGTQHDNALTELLLERVRRRAVSGPN